jgi:hypothetical protein
MEHFASVHVYRLLLLDPYLDPALETGQILKDSNRLLNFLRDGPYTMDGEAIKTKSI